MCFRNNDCLQYNNLPVPRTGSLLQFLVKTVSLVCSSHNYMAHFAINTRCAIKAKAITLRLASSACNPHDKTISEHLYSQNAKPSTGGLCISTCLWSALGFHSFQLNFVNNHEWLSLCPATSKNSSTSRDAQTHTRILLCVEKGLIYKLVHSLKTTFTQVIDFLYKEGGAACKDGCLRVQRRAIPAYSGASRSPLGDTCRVYKPLELAGAGRVGSQGRLTHIALWHAKTSLPINLLSVTDA